MESVSGVTGLELKLQLLVIAVSTDGVEIERIGLLPSEVNRRVEVLEAVPHGYSVTVIPVFGLVAKPGTLQELQSRILSATSYDEVKSLVESF